MFGRSFVLAFLAALVGGVMSEGSRGVAWAHDTERVPIDHKTTEQKAIFLRNLVTNSSAAHTIETSNDANAKAALSRARELVEAADADLAANRLTEADAKLDEAVQLVNGETRRLSQGAVKEKRAQLAYEKRLNAVRTFLAAYERVAAAKERSSALASQIDELKKLVSGAEALAQVGKVEEARVVLDRAYFATKSDIRELRQGDTLVRSLSFETLAEEYAYEVDRNDSHLMLLQLALSENPVSAESAAKIQDMRKGAGNLRKQAEEAAEKGDHKGALTSLLKSTDALIKAIRMTGIFIPGG